LNHLTASWVYRSIAAEARELTGDRRGAEQELTAMWRSLRNANAAGPDGRAMQAASQLALLYSVEGRWEEAADCLSYARDAPDPTGFFEPAVLRLAASARLAAHHGQLAEASALAERAVDCAERTDKLNLRARIWLVLADVQRATGAVAEADAAVAAAIRLYEAKGNIAAAAPLRAAAHAAARWRSGCSAAQQRMSSELVAGVDAGVPDQVGVVEPQNCTASCELELDQKDVGFVGVPSRQERCVSPRAAP
jgi:tetratricopeptide (TPR) repeat protein